MSRSFNSALQWLLLGVCWVGFALALPGIGIIRFCNLASDWLE